MNVFKRIVAFAIAAVMICGALPVSALAVETHDHSEQSDIQPFTSTPDLIEQVKAALAAEGKTYEAEPADQKLVRAVERESEYSFDQAETMLTMGFFYNRTGAEGQISTAHLNLDKATMTKLVDRTLKAYYLDGVIQPEYVVEQGIVTAINFTMRESFAAGLNEIETGVADSAETEPTEPAEEETVTEPETEAEVEENPTAVASYTASPTAEKPYPFTDVPTKHWAHTAVNYLYQRGIVSGVSSTRYGANANVTRGQAVMMIWRAMGSPAPTGKNPFADVRSSDYFVDAVVWAVDQGIVAGTDATHFSPNANITREQLVTIMYGVAAFEGKDTTQKGSLSGFKDSARIAKYAQEPTRWAVKAGLVGGYEDGTFRPQGNATRAEYAQILYKYLLIEVAETHKLTKVPAKEATCAAEGVKEHYKCTDCGKLFADANGKTEIKAADTVVAKNPKNHSSITHVPAKASTDTVKGNVEYWKCEGCGKLYLDKELTKEATMADVELPLDANNHPHNASILTRVDEVKATCIAEGVKEHWKCSKCDRLFADADGKTETTAAALKIPVDANNHTQVTHVPAKASTDTVKGNVEYWKCEGCGKLYLDEELTKEATMADIELPLDENNHPHNADTLTHVEEVAATCTEKGTKEHWKCDRCDRLFADADGKTETTAAALEIPVDANNHNFQLVDEKKPTCCEPGIVEHYECACGAIMDKDHNVVEDMKDLEIAPTGHTPAEDDENVQWAWANKRVDVLDEDGKPQTYLMFDSETGEISAGNKWTLAKECPTVTFTCAGCGEEFTVDTTVESYVLTNEMLEERVNAYAEELAKQLIGEYVNNKVMEYVGANGTMPSDEQINAWAGEAQNDPELMGKVQASANQKAFEMAMGLGSTFYVATAADKTADGEAVVEFSNEVNATQEKAFQDWATMCSFNEYYAKYFGIASNYWSSKNTEGSPMGAVIYMASQEEADLIPWYNLDEDMMCMLTQAFMAYVQQYGSILDAQLDEAMALVDHEELDTVDKLLLLHDWLAENATFDMQALNDRSAGKSAGPEPIEMTAFGALLSSQVPKAENSTWEGAVCLGYAATYTLLVQEALGAFDGSDNYVEKYQADPFVDFAKIQYLANVADVSIAAGDSGFGDGDDMFYNAHYLNAVKVGNNWYYIDACYDDINPESISQERVETDGNVGHGSFLLAPSTWEEMYEKSFSYMDSLYDGMIWNRVYDQEAGDYKYTTGKRDDDDNLILATQEEIDAAKEQQKEDTEATKQQKPLSSYGLYYYYEKSEQEGEKRYEDGTYEKSWFVSANSTINYDPDTQYFYYTSGTMNSYAAMKDMMDKMEDLKDQFGDSMDGMDSSSYKDKPNMQDRIVRRHVDQPNESPEDEGSSSNPMSFSMPNDPYCEVLFHLGYGTTGKQANDQYQADIEDSSFSFGGNDEEEEPIVTGAWYDLCVEDATYRSNYPEIVHSTVMMDGKLYFNIGNCIYTFNKAVKDLSLNIDSITDLELVKVKEYNAFDKQSNGKRFTGMSFDYAEGSTYKYHPIAALNVHDVVTWDGQTRNAVPTLFVSLGTNLSESYKDADGNTYTAEAYNYNPAYNRYMAKDDEEQNKNTEFMWCANVVQKIPVKGLLDDLASGATSEVKVDAYCAHDGFTETRTTKYGLTKGDKVVEEDTALMHDYQLDEKENTLICTRCLEAHEHDYSDATEDDIQIVWEEVKGEDGTVTGLNAEAHIVCTGDEFCGHEEDVECKVSEPDESGVYTATATYTVGEGDKATTITKTETRTIEGMKHTEHTYGDPVFAWNENQSACTAEFTCTADKIVCLNSEAGKDTHKITVECEVDAETKVATVTGPDGKTHSNTYHDKHTYELVEDSDSWKYTAGSEDKEAVMTYSATYKCTVKDCADTVVITDQAATHDEENDVWTTTVKVGDQEIPVSHKHTFEDDKDECECGYVKEPEKPAHVHDYQLVKDSEKWTYQAAEGDKAESMTYTATYECKAEGNCDRKTINAENVGIEHHDEDGSWTATYTVNGEKKTSKHVHNFTDGKCGCGYLEPVEEKHNYKEVATSVIWKYKPAAGDEKESMTYSAKYKCQDEGCDAEQTFTEKKAQKIDEDNWVVKLTIDGQPIEVSHTHKDNDDGKCICGYTMPAGENPDNGESGNEGE